jgi:hypothetical protein
MDGPEPAATAWRNKPVRTLRAKAAGASLANEAGRDGNLDQKKEGSCIAAGGSESQEIVPKAD